MSICCFILFYTVVFVSSLMSINRSRSRGKKDKDPASPSMGAMNGLHSRFPSSLKGNSLFFFQPPTQAPSTSVDLSSTLSQFGFAGFDSWRYVSQYFADHPIESSIEHHLELVDRKNITARALRTFVTEHFGHFIDTAKQIQFVENDMSVLHNLLIEYRKALRENMELTSPPDEDERLRIERDAEKIMQKMSSFNVDQDLISLEEVLHELGSLVFERLFEQAINLIENVSEKFSDLKVEMTDHANLSTLDKLKKEFDDIVIRLVENLTNELRLPTIKLNEQRRISSLLIRLGKWNIAIDIFLQSRSDALTVDIRAIVLHGDLALYVDELANLLCTSVVSACQEFRKMFSESKLLSRIRFSFL